MVTNVDFGLILALLPAVLLFLLGAPFMHPPCLPYKHVVHPSDGMFDYIYPAAHTGIGQENTPGRRDFKIFKTACTLALPRGVACGF